MDYTEVAAALDSFRVGSVEKSWKMTDEELSYENEFIRLVRVDSSNHWVSTMDMEKQWSFVVEKKKDFFTLPGFEALCNKYGMRFTPVRTGRNKGCYGFRFYNMKREPNAVVVKTVLDYIFSLDSD